MIRIVSKEELDIHRNVERGTKQQLETVQEIIRLVERKGDLALRTLTSKFDGADLEKLEVSREEMEAAQTRVDQTVTQALTKAASRIRQFHEHQRQKSWFTTEADGTILGQKVLPLERVGVYVPGGKAAYPSSVLMNVIPAKVAGVQEVVMVTPPLPGGEVYAHAGCRPNCRSGSNLQSGRSTGDRRIGLWYGKYSAGG